MYFKATIKENGIIRFSKSYGNKYMYDTVDLYSPLTKISYGQNIPFELNIPSMGPDIDFSKLLHIKSDGYEDFYLYFDDHQTLK
jgi:hypothetical protein